MTTKTFTAICELREEFPEWGKIEREDLSRSYTRETTYNLEVKQGKYSWLFENEDDIPKSCLNPDEPFEAKIWKSVRKIHGCCKCGSKEADACERYSLGITAGIYCDEHWESSPYRKEGKEGYDVYDAGEYYGEEDY